MDIYLLRHASAGQPMANHKKDAKRPLDEEGILQTRYIGRLLAQLDVQLDVIVSSPLVRARQTASIAANELAYEGKIELSEALAPGAAFADFRDLLRRYAKSDAVMFVGHNPSLSEFLGRLIGNAASRALVEMKKGAVARVETAGKSGRLLWMVTPKIARVLQPVRKKSSRPKTSRK
jgi:phosphohistidine phosphatase